jgi:hypothetical protein
MDEERKVTLDDILPEVLADISAQQTAESNANAEAPAVAEAPEANTNAPTAEGETVPESVPVTPTEGMQTEAAVQAEAAIRAATELQNANARIAELEAQLAEASRVHEQANRQNTERIDEVLNMPTPLNYSEMEYLSDDERQAKHNEYVGNLTKYIMQEVSKQYGNQMKPIVDSYRKAQADAEEAELLNLMKGMQNELPGFAEHIDAINTLTNTPSFANIPKAERLTAGYLMALGRDKLNEKPMTADDIYKKAVANPEVMRMIAAEQAKQLENKQNIPVFTASAGSASAPVDVPKKPETLEEASKQAFESFGIKYL